MADAEDCCFNKKDVFEALQENGITPAGFESALKDLLEQNILTHCQRHGGFRPSEAFINSISGHSREN